MNKKLALLGVATFVLGVLPGCFLPCQLCAACLTAGSGSTVSAPVDAAPLPEVGPQLQTAAMTTAVAR